MSVTFGCRNRRVPAREPDAFDVDVEVLVGYIAQPPQVAVFFGEAVAAEGDLRLIGLFDETVPLAHQEKCSVGTERRR